MTGLSIEAIDWLARGDLGEARAWLDSGHDPGTWLAVTHDAAPGVLPGMTVRAVAQRYHELAQREVARCLAHEAGLAIPAAMLHHLVRRSSRGWSALLSTFAALDSSGVLGDPELVEYAIPERLREELRRSERMVELLEPEAETLPRGLDGVWESYANSDGYFCTPEDVQDGFVHRLALSADGTFRAYAPCDDSRLVEGAWEASDRGLRFSGRFANDEDGGSLRHLEGDWVPTAQTLQLELPDIHEPRWATVPLARQPRLGALRAMAREVYDR